MPKRSSKKPKDKDVNQVAWEILVATTSEPKKTPTSKNEEKPKKNPHAAALGKLGGLKGGKARAEKLSPKKRSEIAKKAAESRWGKTKPKDQ
ncbi:MAG: hypothetical protein KC643_06465 [Nitrospira sp.]|nr:hypothetical protein [Nitrospira sp.]MCA9465073.1 hypothetical protein [Nitrospira sp.]